MDYSKLHAQMRAILMDELDADLLALAKQLPVGRVELEEILRIQELRNSNKIAILLGSSRQ